MRFNLFLIETYDGESKRISSIDRNVGQSSVAETGSEIYHMFQIVRRMVACFEAQTPSFHAWSYHVFSQSRLLSFDRQQLWQGNRESILFQLPQRLSEPGRGEKAESLVCLDPFPKEAVCYPLNLF